MINFDTNHQKFNSKITQNLGKVGKKILVGGLLVTSMFLFSGCCQLDGDHLHKYIGNDNSIVYLNDWNFNEVTRKIGDEKISFTKSEITINENNYYNVDTNTIKNKTLIKIEDNIPLITEKLATFSAPWLEYEYSGMMPMKVGKVTVMRRYHRWTTNPDEHKSSLTGKVQEGRYVYYGYKINENLDGMSETVSVSTYQSFEDLLKDGCNYCEEQIARVEYSAVKELDMQIEDNGRTI